MSILAMCARADSAFVVRRDRFTSPSSLMYDPYSDVASDTDPSTTPTPRSSRPSTRARGSYPSSLSQQRQQQQHTPSPSRPASLSAISLRSSPYLSTLLPLGRNIDLPAPLAQALHANSACFCFWPDHALVHFFLFFFFSSSQLFLLVFWTFVVVCVIRRARVCTCRCCGTPRRPLDYLTTGADHRPPSPCRCVSIASTSGGLWAQHVTSAPPVPLPGGAPGPRGCVEWGGSVGAGVSRTRASVSMTTLPPIHSHIALRLIFDALCLFILITLSLFLFV